MFPDSVYAVFTLLLVAGMAAYLPSNIISLERRALYYLTGVAS